MARAVAEEEPVRRQKKTSYFDYSLFFIIVFLLGFGLVMLYSTSAYTATTKFDNSMYYIKKQILAVILGSVVSLFLIAVGYHVLQKLCAIIYLTAYVLCIAVNFIGSSYNNSTRWIYIGPISVQPSEIAKVGVIIFLAAVISRAPKQMKSMKQAMKTLLILVLPLVGIVAYTNLSTAIIIAGIAFVMVFVANPHYVQFVMLLVAAIGLLAVGILVASYRATRIMVWLHPENYDEGYQTLQGLYAIGSGGFFGKGLGQSMQKLFVPEASNDMIFSIICEELGLFGAICLLVMYLILIWRFAYISTHARDMFGSYLCIGIMTHIALQVILNVAVVTNTIPNTGITLPFISYGGSSMTILIIEMGIALAVSKEMVVD